MFYETRASATGACCRTIPSRRSSRRARSAGFRRARLDGRINLAPYSFFNAFPLRRPIVGFSSEGYKDSAAFAAESGEFVANLASFDLMQPMSETSAPLPRGRQRIRIRRADDGAVPAGQGAARRGGACRPRMQGQRGRPVKAPQGRDARQLSRDRRGRRLPYRRRASSRTGVSTPRRARPLARCGYQDYAVVETADRAGAA